MSVKNNNYIKLYRDGFISGFIATSVSHPFFNMKNVVQTGQVLTYKNLCSPKWLYGGFFRAALGYSGEKMMVFGTYNSLKGHDVNPTLAGLIAGGSSSFITTLSEQLAIDKQSNISKYSVKHLYKGIIPTAARESIGFGIHFTVYDYLSNIHNKEREYKKTSIIGVAAIVCSWTVIAPIDRLKTVIQSGKFNIKTYDFRNSFNGFKFCMLRAVPFHVVSFSVMEHLSKST